MPSDHEIERITEVYRSYARDQRTVARHSEGRRGNQMMAHERWRTIGQMLLSSGRLPLGSRRILDVGTGGGGDIAMLVGLGANPALCSGIDLMPERIEAARRRYATIDFRVGNAEQLDYPDGEFDIVVLSTIISSILDESIRRSVAVEIDRVLKPGGAVLWYDMRYPSPRNLNVRPVSRREIRRLFPELRGPLRTVTLLPPIARRLSIATSILYPLLAGVPFLRSHLLGLLAKSATDDGISQSKMRSS